MSSAGSTVVPRGARAARPPRDRRTARALRLWALLIAASFAAGAILHALGVLTIDHLPPLHGHFRVPPLALLPAAAFGGAAVLFLPALAARLGFGRALLVSYGCALAWTM